MCGHLCVVVMACTVFSAFDGCAEKNESQTISLWYSNVGFNFIANSLSYFYNEV